MYFDGIAAVFFFKSFRPRFGWQFSGFAHRYESGTEPGCQYGTHDEAARFDAGNFGDAFVFVKAVKFVAQPLHRFSVFEYGGEIFEQYSGLRKVGNIANLFVNIVYFHEVVCLLFHVEHYLPNKTSRMFMSLGDMPGIREACAMVSGSIFESFWRASMDICCMVL